jgi:hypothetical protein
VSLGEGIFYGKVALHRSSGRGAYARRMFGWARLFTPSIASVLKCLPHIKPLRLLKRYGCSLPRSTFALGLCVPSVQMRPWAAVPILLGSVFLLIGITFLLFTGHA